jgi:sterol desaturase/sphingolipid hydroxylase (fatty acid hydroxylase superfamily)
MPARLTNKFAGPDNHGTGGNFPWAVEYSIGGSVLDAAKRVSRWLVFPLLIGGSTIATYVALERGVGVTVAVVVCGGAAALVIGLLERWLPYAQTWRLPRRDVATDLLHLLISGLLVESLPGLVPVASAVWPVAWPAWPQLALAIVLAELLQYAMHRLHHEWRPLWRIHAVHHSALRLYWLNSTRTHPLEALLNAAVMMTPMIVLGVGAPVLALYTVFASTFRLLQHSNVDVRLGPLNWIFSMAEVHRWHHSRSLDEANANYGAITLLWDLVFRTRRVPTDRAPSLEVGLGDMPDFPTDYLAQVASPFAARLWHRGSPIDAVAQSSRPADG